jgi:hypothetical protein
MTTFTEALSKAERLAREALPPESHERLDAALVLVRNGSVFQDDAGGWHVASTSTKDKNYHVNGTCSCHDVHYNQPPRGMCKHRLSVYLARKVAALMHVAAVPVDPEIVPEPWPDNDPEPTPDVITAGSNISPLPEAPVSITLKASVYGFETLVTLRGTDFASVQAQVEQAAQWLKSQAPAQGQGREDWCSKHGIQMKLHSNSKGQWYSHFIDDKHCKGR